MNNKDWWELLTDEELEELVKYFPDYKNYEVPTIDMRWVIDSFNESQSLQNKKNNN